MVDQTECVRKRTVRVSQKVLDKVREGEIGPGSVVFRRKVMTVKGMMTVHFSVCGMVRSYLGTQLVTIMWALITILYFLLCWNIAMHLCDRSTSVILCNTLLHLL